jgi:large subunit ribosomal protein L35
MSGCKQVARPISSCLRQTWRQDVRIYAPSFPRTFSTSSFRQDEGFTEATSPSAPALDPALVSTRKEEKELLKMGINPIGSRRRRAALRTSANIPFEQLPFQCFQEARKLLQADREEKLELIKVERDRIARLEEQDPAVSGGEKQKQTRLDSMQRRLEELKILADINDPVIKKRFEDGEGTLPLA